MTRCLLLSAFLWLALAGPASGQQLFLNHNDCSAGGTAKNKNMNCANTARQNVVIMSVDVGYPDVAGIITGNGIVDLQAGTSQSSVMPAFWQFQLTGCSGPTNWLWSADFTSGPWTCVDLWQGRATGGGRYGGVVSNHVPDGNRARITFSWSVPPETPAFAPAGNEVYVCRITIKQATALTCAGCNTPVCMVYEYEAFNQLNGGQREITNSDYITFNDSSGVTGCPSTCHYPPCYPPIPTERNTWGQVKALYR
jgi:hypothetical protein